MLGVFCQTQSIFVRSVHLVQPSTQTANSQSQPRCQSTRIYRPRKVLSRTTHQSRVSTAPTQFPGSLQSSSPTPFWSYQSPQNYRAPKNYQSPQKYQAPAQYGAGGSAGSKSSTSAAQSNKPDSPSKVEASGGGGGPGIGGGSGGTGRGGGGGGGGGGGSDGSEAADGGGRGRMQPLTVAFALFVLVGGLMGYKKKRSKESLIASSIIAGLLLISAYLMGRPDTTYGVRLALVTTGSLAAYMGKGYWDKRKVFPQGVLAAISTVLTLGYIGSL